MIEGLTAPLDASIQIIQSWVKECTLLGGPAWWSIVDGTIFEDLSVEAWVLAQGTVFDLPQQVNRERRIPLETGKPTPGIAPAAIEVWTDEGSIEVTLDLIEEHPYLLQVFELAPIRTDLDMEITGTETFGESVTQARLSTCNRSRACCNARKRAFGACGTRASSP